MKDFKVSTGIQYFNLNGHELAFDPADMNFIDSFLTMFENLEQTMQESDEIKKAVEENPREAFRIAREKDAIIRKEIDGVFGEGTADHVYKGNLTSLADGLPVWLNFSLAIVEIMEQNANEQKVMGNPRMEKYMAKYAKYQRK